MVQESSATLRLPIYFTVKFFRNMIAYTIESKATRERARETIKLNTIVNEKLACSVPGCETNRRGISRFCKTHQYAHQYRGHPTLRLPVGDERRQMLAEGENMLAWLAEKHGRETVKSWLKAAARRITAPASMVVPPRNIQKQMTMRTRAEIILAWYLHRRTGDSVEVVKLYLAAELYTWRNDLFFGPTIRNGFTNRVVGAIVANKAKVEEEREVYRSWIEEQPSWATTRLRRHEETVRVKDKYRPQQSVYKMIGKMVREILSKEGLLISIRLYNEHTMKKYK